MRPTENELRRGEEAVWGPRPAAARMRLVSFRPLVKNSLRGFATIELPPGLILRELPVLIGTNGRAWVALPRKPVLDETGQQKRDANGRPQYVAIGEWTTRTLSDRFSARVIELIEQQYPGALGGGAP